MRHCHFPRRRPTTQSLSEMRTWQRVATLLRPTLPGLAHASTRCPLTDGCLEQSAGLGTLAKCTGSYAADCARGTGQKPSSQRLPDCCHPSCCYSKTQSSGACSDGPGSAHDTSAATAATAATQSGGLQHRDSFRWRVGLGGRKSNRGQAGDQRQQRRHCRGAREAVPKRELPGLGGICRRAWQEEAEVGQPLTKQGNKKKRACAPPPPQDDQRHQGPPPPQITQQVGQQIQAASARQWHSPDRDHLLSANPGSHSQRYPGRRSQLRSHSGEAQSSRGEASCTGAATRCTTSRRRSSTCRAGKSPSRNALLLEESLLRWPGGGHGPTRCDHLDDHQSSASKCHRRGGGGCQQFRSQPDQPATNFGGDHQQGASTVQGSTGQEKASDSSFGRQDQVSPWRALSGAHMAHYELGARDPAQRRRIMTGPLARDHAPIYLGRGCMSSLGDHGHGMNLCYAHDFCARLRKEGQTCGCSQEHDQTGPQPGLGTALCLPLATPRNPDPPPLHGTIYSAHATVDAPGLQIPLLTRQQWWRPWVASSSATCRCRRVSPSTHRNVASQACHWQWQTIIRGAESHNWPMRGRRIGEAATPGPAGSSSEEPSHTRRVRGKSSPPFCRSNTATSSASSTSHSSSSMSTPERAQNTPAATGQASTPDTVAMPSQAVNNTAIPAQRFQIHRQLPEQEAPAPAWLVPNYVAQTKQRRWQISAQPRWSSSNRKSASEALEHWYQVHGRKILDESRQVVEEKIAQMQRAPVAPPEEPAPPQAQHLNLGKPAHMGTATRACSAPYTVLAHS